MGDGVKTSEPTLMVLRHIPSTNGREGTR